MIVDSLCFLGESIFGHRAAAGDLLARMDEVGIDKAVVVPMKPRDYHLGPANELVAEAVRQHPERLVGLARVDPLRGDEAVAELERAHASLGLHGVFLHPWEETFRVSAPFVDPVFEAAGRLGAPVVVAAGYPWLSEGLQVGDVARRFPAVPLVLTNGGQLNISGLGQTDAELALQENPSTVIQTAGVYLEDFLEGVALRLGAERVLFSSAYPLMDPRLEIRRVQWCHLDDAAKSAMLGGNAARIFGL